MCCWEDGKLLYAGLNVCQTSELSCPPTLLRMHSLMGGTANHIVQSVN